MTSAATEPRPRPMARVAQVLGCTEGQAYTALIAVALAVTAALTALPPLDRVSRGPAAGGAEVASAPSPPPGTDTPPPEVDAPPESASAPLAGAVEMPPTGMSRESSAPGGRVVADASASPSGPAPAFVASGFGAAAMTVRVGAPGAPDGVAVDGSGRVFVATNNGVARGGAGASKVMRYALDGTLDKELTVRGQSEARHAGLTGIALTPNGSVFVLDSAPPRVLRLDLDRGRQETHVTFADLPGLDGLPQPRALTLDAEGTLFVTDSGQGMIWRVTPDGKAAPWHVFGEGEATSVTGIAVDGNAALLVVTTTPLEGTVHRIETKDDRSAGERTALATLEPFSGPIGLTTTPGGAIAVALAESNQLLLLGSDGGERARLTADEVAEAAGIPLDGPTGVVVRDRSVLVTNQSPRANDASHWVVFDIPLTP